MSETREQATEIRVIHEGERAWRTWWTRPARSGRAVPRWTPSRAPTAPFTTGFWRREPDTWSFERPYDEVALILAGEADIETDGRVLAVRAGDLLVTPKGSAGTWRIKETIVKFFAISDRR